MSRPETRTPPAYRARHPERTPFYAVLYRYYNEFKSAYEERFQKEYGRWRSVVDKVVGKYFQCGVYLGGFARIKCEKCGKEKLLAYESDPLLCECGGTMKVVSVIEARSQPDVVGKILASIKFVFDVLRLPERSPPAPAAEWDESSDDGSRPDAYCF